MRDSITFVCMILGTLAGIFSAIMAYAAYYQAKGHSRKDSAFPNYDTSDTYTPAAASEVGSTRRKSLLRSLAWMLAIPYATLIAAGTMEVVGLDNNDTAASVLLVSFLIAEFVIGTRAVLIFFGVVRYK